MKFSLSTNWCNRRLSCGEAIADAALELGFAGLELGFRTTAAQLPGIRARLDRIPVGSVHAFCPVPLSAPHGCPELYLLADPDASARALARLHVLRNVELAADFGAGAVVLHAGRIDCGGWLKRRERKRRLERGRMRLDPFRRELDLLVPELERRRVRLGLENLPYLEGFPDELELSAVAGEWVRPWLDTGHDFVRSANGWLPDGWRGWPAVSAELQPLGLHINDSLGGDDHLPPGRGKVDFAALRAVAAAAEHVVFEPHEEVTADELRQGLDFLRRTWQ